MQSSRSYSWFPLTLLWFGAAMSVAEINTGGLTAAAGIGPGLWAVLGGHLVGAALLGLMGYLGFREGLPSLMCTRIAFGVYGSRLLSLANIIQLLGWTTVMIQLNSQAVGGITSTLWGFESTVPAVLGLGALIALWALWESQGKHGGNTAAVIMIALLGLVITWTLWKKAAGVGLPAGAAAPAMSFGEAFELSLVMPLSWMPLVADYASRAKSARAACLGPALGYLTGSLWMYGLGFAGALLTGEANPTPMMLAAGLGVIALSVLALSTVITTFLDVYSAVASARNIFPNLPERPAGLAVVCIGTGAALFWDSTLYIGFLHLIGAVFAPLGAVLFTDAFMLRHDDRDLPVSPAGLISLATGVAGYVLFTFIGSPVGPTLSCLALTLVIHLTLRLVWPRGKKAA